MTDMRTWVVVITQHGWGRGISLTEAQKVCAKANGAGSFKSHLRDLGNSKWVASYIESPEEKDPPRVNEMGDTEYFGKLIKTTFYEGTSVLKEVTP